MTRTVCSGKGSLRTKEGRENCFRDENPKRERVGDCIDSPSEPLSDTYPRVSSDVPLLIRRPDSCSSLFHGRLSCPCECIVRITLVASVSSPGTGPLGDFFSSRVEFLSFSRSRSSLFSETQSLVGRVVPVSCCSVRSTLHLLRFAVRYVKSMRSRTRSLLPGDERWRGREISVVSDPWFCGQRKRA